MSGSGNDAVQSTPSAKPSYITDAIHGYPVARFSGAQLLQLTTAINLVPGTVFVVGKHSDTGYGEIMGYTGVNRQFRYDNNYTSWMVASTAPTLGNPVAYGNTSVYNILTALVGRSFARLAVNGVFGTATNHATTSWALDRVGWGYNLYLVGDIAELIFCTDTLSSADQAVISRFLSDLYGIPVQ